MLSKNKSLGNSGPYLHLVFQILLEDLLWLLKVFLHLKARQFILKKLLSTISAESSFSNLKYSKSYDLARFEYEGKDSPPFFEDAMYFDDSH